MPAVRRSDERKFWKGLCILFRGVIGEAKKGQGFLNGLTEGAMRFIKPGLMDQEVERLVSEMVNNQRKQSALSWRQKAALSRNGKKFISLIQKEMKGPVGERVLELIEENSQLIRTLPDEWARYASEYAFRMAMKGERPEVIEAKLRKIMPEHITKNLKCIARTECAKANAAIVQARAEACGIRAYIWRCVRDERVRDAHRQMDGILVFYNDPPNPEALFGGARPYGNYHAGNTYNCRCFQEPVVDIRFLPGSIRVHDHGSIRMMTRAQIEQKYGKIA